MGSIREKREKKKEREAGRGREPMHHSNPDRPLIQLTDRDTGAAGMICLRVVQRDMGHLI